MNKLLNWWLNGKKPPVKKLPEDAALPDIITKMLVDKGCTINKEGAEAVAGYIISTCLQITQDIKSSTEKVTRDIKDERARWP
jgi:hypothetical protein